MYRKLCRVKIENCISVNKFTGKCVISAKLIYFTSAIICKHCYIFENPFAVKILGEVKGQVAQPRQKGELLAQVTYAFDSEQIVTVTVSDPRSKAVVARFSVNAQVSQTQEVVKEDLSELQAIFAKFIS